MPGLQLAGVRGVECSHCTACAAQEQGQNQVRTVWTEKLSLPEVVILVASPQVVSNQAKENQMLINDDNVQDAAGRGRESGGCPHLGHGHGRGGVRGGPLREDRYEAVRDHRQHEPAGMNAEHHHVHRSTY